MILLLSVMSEKNTSTLYLRLISGLSISETEHTTGSGVYTGERSESGNALKIKSESHMSRFRKNIVTNHSLEL